MVGEWENSSDYHPDTGFPRVCYEIPGFVRRYVGEVQRLDGQPGCVKLVNTKEIQRTGNKLCSLSSLFKKL